MSGIGQHAYRVRDLWSRPVRVLALLAIATAGVGAMDPAHRHVPLCPFHSMTGWDCPFCGGLRSVDALLHGQFATAVRSNVLFIAAIPVIATLWVRWFYADGHGRALPAWPRWLRWSLVALLVVFTVVRNLPPMGFLRQGS